MPNNGRKEATTGLSQGMVDMELTQGAGDTTQPPPGLTANFDISTPRAAAESQPSGTEQLKAPVSMEKPVLAGWAEWTEETLQANQEFMQALAATRKVGDEMQLVCDPRRTFQDLRSFLLYMKTVGYDMEGADPWRNLGMDTTAGSGVTAELIEDRIRRCRLALSAAEAIPEWPQGDRRKIQLLEQNLEGWRQICVDRLPEVQKMQKKQAGFTPAPFLEPPVALEEWLIEYAQHPGGAKDREWASALWHSDIARTGRPGAGKCMGTGEAKDFEDAMHKSKERAMQAVESVPAKGFILWVAREAEHCNRLMANVQHLLTHTAVPLDFILLCEREPTPNLGDAELMEDVWRHPAMQPKWRHMVVDIVHLCEPATTTLTLQGKVSTALRGFTLLRLASGAAPCTPRYVQWKQLLLEEESDHVILVDARAAQHMQIRRGLAQVEGLEGVSWEGPRRSPGTQPKEQRICFRVYAARGQFSEMGAHMLARAMKVNQRFAGAIIGQEQLLRTKGARILELTSITAFETFEKLVEEAVVISPTELLIHTAESQQDWEAEMTRALQDDPGVAAIQVRWRRSFQSGRPWARPRVLSEVVHAVTRRAKKPPDRANEEDNCGQVRIQGPLGSQPAALMTKVMQLIGEKAGVQWSPQKSERQLEVNQWRMQFDTAGRPTGAVDFKLASLTDVALLQNAVNDDIVQVNGTMMAIQIRSEAMACRSFRRS